MYFYITWFQALTLSFHNNLFWAVSAPYQWTRPSPSLYIKINLLHTISRYCFIHMLFYNKALSCLINQPTGSPFIAGTRNISAFLTHIYLWEYRLLDMALQYKRRMWDHTDFVAYKPLLNRQDGGYTLPRCHDDAAPAPKENVTHPVLTAGWQLQIWVTLQ